MGSFAVLLWVREWMDRCECCILRFSWGGNGLYHCSPTGRFINTPNGSYARAAPHNYSYIHNPASLHYFFPTACLMLSAKILNTSDCKTFQIVVNSQTLFSEKKSVLIQTKSLGKLLHATGPSTTSHQCPSFSWPPPPHCSQWVQRNLRHLQKKNQL